MGIPFIPNVEQKIYSWSYSKLSCLESCPRHFFWRVYGIKSKRKSPPITQAGTFLHNLLENYYGEKQSFSAAINTAVTTTKLVSLNGRWLLPEYPLKRLVELGAYSIGVVDEFIKDMEGAYGRIEWLFEADMRITKDFKEVEAPFNKAMVRSRKTWFEGRLDMLGVSASGVVIIVDYKYYDVPSVEAHEDQIRVYNVLVPAILREWGYTNLRELKNFIIFLKQGERVPLSECDLTDGEVDRQRWLAAKIGAARERAQSSDENTATPSEDACKYCEYRGYQCKRNV